MPNYNLKTTATRSNHPTVLNEHLRFYSKITLPCDRESLETAILIRDISHSKTFRRIIIKGLTSQNQSILINTLTCLKNMSGSLNFVEVIINKSPKIIDLLLDLTLNKTTDTPVNRKLLKQALYILSEYAKYRCITKLLLSNEKFIPEFLNRLSDKEFVDWVAKAISSKQNQRKIAEDSTTLERLKSLIKRPQDYEIKQKTFRCLHKIAETEHIAFITHIK